MNLLLLLSALLSAFAGASAAARPAQLAVAVARSADVADVVRPAARNVAHRPVGTLPDLVEVARAGVTPARATIAPRFLSSRRE